METQFTRSQRWVFQTGQRGWYDDYLRVVWWLFDKAIYPVVRDVDSQREFRESCVVSRGVGTTTTTTTTDILAPASIANSKMNMHCAHTMLCNQRYFPAPPGSRAMIKSVSQPSQSVSPVSHLPTHGGHCTWRHNVFVVRDEFCKQSREGGMIATRECSLPGVRVRNRSKDHKSRDTKLVFLRTDLKTHWHHK